MRLQKKLTLVLTAFFLSSLFPAALTHVSAALGPNILTNPGFEEEATETSTYPGWTPYDIAAATATIGYSTEIKHSGTRSVYIARSDSANAGFQQNVVLTGDTKDKLYRLSSYVYVDSATAKPYFNYTIIDYAGGTLNRVDKTNAITATVGAWKYFSVLVRLPAETTRISAIAASYGTTSPGTTATVYFDDISITEITDPSKNIFINGDLEESYDTGNGTYLPTGYTFDKPANVAYGTAYGYSGNGVRLLVDTAHNNFNNYFHEADGIVDLPGGQNGLVTFWYRSNTEVRYRFFYKVSGGGEQTTTLKSLAASAQWTKAIVPYTLPDNCTSLGFNLWAIMKTGGYADFDEIRLELDATSISYYKDTNEIEFLTAGDITAECRFVSDVTEAQGGSPVIFMAALYKKVNDSNLLCGIKTDSATVYKGTPQTLTTEALSVPNEDTSSYFIKTFVWHSLSGAVPYFEAELLATE